MTVHECLCQLPPLYTYENLKWEDTPQPIKFHGLRLNWTWIPTEYDPEKRIAFGMVHGFESEIGYFSHDDLIQAGCLVE
jgi:hypothetical protein